MTMFNAPVKRPLWMTASILMNTTVVMGKVLESFVNECCDATAVEN